MKSEKIHLEGWRGVFPPAYKSGLHLHLHLLHRDLLSFVVLTLLPKYCKHFCPSVNFKNYIYLHTNILKG